MLHSALLPVLAWLFFAQSASAHFVISEVMWMGSDLSTADEWIELAAISDTPQSGMQSLSGWTLTSLAGNGTDTVLARFGSSAGIPSGDYAVVSNYPASQSRLAVAPVFVSTSMSLPNTKLRLRLRNPAGAIVDEVDDGVGAPFAGANTTGSPKASMERIILAGSGADKTNWRTASTTRGIDEGIVMFGTPGFENGSAQASSSASSLHSSSESSGVLISSEPYIEPKSESSSFSSDSSVSSESLTLRSSSERSEGGSVSPSCTTLTGSSLRIQQGGTYGIGHVSINVQAQFAASSSGIKCHWEFGDGAVSESCNPPYHTYSQPGSYDLTLSLMNQCSTTVVHTLDVFVAQKNTNISRSSCKPTAFSGVVLSEIMPNPREGEEEWIELFNPSNEMLSLCGWSLDDSSGGSKAFALDSITLAPQQYLVLPSSVTKITWNNEDEFVRLIAPLARGGTSVVQEIRYERSQERQSLLATAGTWLPSRTPTPGSGNAAGKTEDLATLPAIVIRAVLPNPAGKDTGAEWVELENLSGRPKWLHHWVLKTASSQFLLEELVLAAGERKRLYLGDTLALANTDGSLGLANAYGELVAYINWAMTAQGEVIEQEWKQYRSMTAKQVQEEEWKPQGVDTEFEAAFPTKLLAKNLYTETVRALIENKKLDQLWYSKNGSESGVILRTDGQDLARLFVQQGLLYADTRESVLGDYYVGFQRDAQQFRRGLWANPETARAILAVQDKWQAESLIAQRGYTASMDVKGPLIGSGSVVRFKATLPSQWYLSKNGGAYQEFSGSLVIKADTKLAVYAVPILANSRAETKLKTPIIHKILLTKQEKYPSEIVFSEIAPSPAKGEEEWIELYNFSDQRISLGGWMLGLEGKKPKVIPAQIGIDPNAYLVLTSKLTGVSLKNAGDTVILQSPDGKIVRRVRYPQIKTGYTYQNSNLSSALYDKQNDWCISTTPTIMSANRCTAAVKKVKKAAAPKKSSKKSSASAASKNSVLEGMKGQIVSGSGNALQLSSEKPLSSLGMGLITIFITISAFGVLLWQKGK